MKDIRKQLEDVALEDPEGGVNVCLEDAIEVVKQRDKEWREKIQAELDKIKPLVSSYIKLWHTCKMQ